MSEIVERSTLDLRYQDHRLRDKAREARLLSSLAQRGIEQPLEGVDTPQGRILLNGFKRYRCAVKLSIQTVPYRSLGSDEASGLITLIRNATDKTLSILEQARLLDELNKVHHLSVGEMARLLDKSKGWVGMRLGMIEGMSEAVLEKIFKGQFSAYSYMYSLRPFMRMNGIKKKEIDEFVDLTSGKALSIRDLDILARGYFSGNDNLREQLKNGDVSWALRRLKENGAQASGEDCTELERNVLRKLEVLRALLVSMIYYSNDTRLKSPYFRVQANLLTDGILKQWDDFSSAIRRLDDKTRQT